MPWSYLACAYLTDSSSCRAFTSCCRASWRRSCMSSSSRMRLRWRSASASFSSISACMEARACGGERSRQRGRLAKPPPPSPGPPYAASLGGWGQASPTPGEPMERAPKQGCCPAQETHRGCTARNGLPGRPDTSTRRSPAPSFTHPRAGCPHLPRGSIPHPRVTQPPEPRGDAWQQHGCKSRTCS